MTEFGELSAVALDRAREAKCPLCGKRHKTPKPAEGVVYPVKSGKLGWMRGEAMSPRNRAWDGDEMHHCVAFSAFHVGGKRGKRDFLPEINWLLSQQGYDPNRKLNCVALPGRSHPHGSYGHFWARLDGDAPLQLHLGRHDGSALNASKAMVLYVLRHVAEPADGCKERSATRLSSSAKTLVGQAEDYAYHCTLRYLAPFRLHPRRLPEACAQYAKRHGGSVSGPRLVEVLEARWEGARTGVTLQGNPFAKANGA
jgi:hypothetical protein